MDILVTKRLTLRPPLEVDADDIACNLANSNISKMLGSVPQPYRRSDALSWMEKVKPEQCVFTVHRNRLIGCVGVHQHPDRLELGYWLAQPAWGNGFATEAARAVLARAFRLYDADCIVSGAASDNPASLRVQDKLGFEVTGRATHTFLSRRGQVDTLRTRLTRGRFEDLFGSLDSDVAA